MKLKPTSAFRKKTAPPVRTTIVFLQQYSYPDVAGSTMRLTELSSELSKRGFNVTVFSGISSYGSGTNHSRCEMHEGVTIHRLGKIQFNRKTLYGRTLNGLSFSFLVLLSLLKIKRQALVFIDSDPPFLSFIGCILNKLQRRRYILRVADLYPDMAIRLGYLKSGGWADRFWRRLNRSCYSHASGIITLGDRMRKQILSNAPGVNSEKIHVIANWEDGEKIRPLVKSENPFAQKYGLTAKTVVLYSGNLGRAHDLVSVIEAAFILRERKEIIFIFIGDGPQKNLLQFRVQERRLSNVLLLPYQPPDILPYSLTAGDIGLVSMKLDMEGLCVPGKFYTVLAAGLAMLGVLPRKAEMAQWIEDQQCGLWVEPENPEALAQAVNRMHENPDLLRKYQLKARESFEKYFTKNRGVEMHIQVFESILRSSC